jgi:hypothetical protein
MLQGKIFLSVLVLAMLLLAGCSTRESATTAEPVKAASSPAVQNAPQTPPVPSNAPPVVQEKTDKQIQEELLKTVKKGSVMTTSKNWDETSQDDGIVVYPDLQDAEGQTVKFENYPLDVAVEIWTTKFDDSYNQVKDRLVYSGTSSIDSWKDANFLFEGGIRVPFSAIKSTSSDSKYGRLYAKVVLPDGRTIEMKTDSAELKAPPE